MNEPMDLYLENSNVFSVACIFKEIFFWTVRYATRVLLEILIEEIQAANPSNKKLNLQKL